MKLHSRLFVETKPARWIFILSIGFGLLGGILAILQAREVSRLINQVFLNKQDLPGVSGLFSSILIILLFWAGVKWAGELCASIGARRIKQALRERFYTQLTDIGPAYLRSEAGEAETRTGELTNLAIEGIDALDVYYSQYLPQVALSALVPLAILLFVFPTDFLSGVVLLVTAPLLPVFMYLIGSTAESLTRRQWSGLSRMSAYFLDVIQGLTTLKSLGRSNEQVAGVQRVSEQYRQSTMRVLRITFLSALVLELIATLSTAVLAVEIGVRLLYGKMAFEQAFFVLLIAPVFYQPLRTLGLRFHAGMAGVEAAKRIYQILDLPTNTGSLSVQHNRSRKMSNHNPPSIEIKHVNFTYSNGHQALIDVSFKIPAGKMTALVGESGAGKTTLTWLLLGFLKPQSGDIHVNGKSLAELSIKEWRENLAWVSQNPYLFSDTILANIKLARPAATEAEIQHAALLAHADEFIIQLPHGYETQIGERGTRLSAGQAQRIALARAFLKDAPLIILDEATSHLDPEMDAQLQAVVSHLMQGRTVLVIAHHRGTLARADQVVTLHQGRVVETLKVIPSINAIQGAKSLPTQHISCTDLPGTAISSTKIERPEPWKKHSPQVEKRLLKLLSPFIGRIVLSILLGFATLASGVGLMAAAAYIISAAALHPSIADLQVAIVGVRFFGLSRGVFRYLERLVSHDVTFRLLARWRAWFYQALEPLAPARLMQYHSGDLLSRMIGDIATLESFYVRAISPPLVALLVLIALSIFMGAFDTKLAWVLIGFMILAGLGLPLFSFLFSRRLGPRIIQQRAQLSTFLVDGIQGLSDLLTFGQEEDQSKRISQAGAQLARDQGRMAAISALQDALGSLLAALAMLAVLALATVSITQGRLDGVMLGVVALAALTSFEAMQPLPLAAQNFSANRDAARRLFELVNIKPPIKDIADPLTLSSATNLEFRQVSFRYPAWVDENISEKSPFAIRESSFSLYGGKHIAILGPSGAGKTTLINLILRFWDYQHGSILLEGNELRKYRQEDIRKHIAIISQNTYLFSASIRDNLLIARPGASQAEIIQAAKVAQLHDVIQALPDGYNTWIGEHGQRLSAGERQRLAVARAVLKEAPILILDEPTSNLDPATERAVLSSIADITQGRNMIYITQHMVGLEMMDEILVLKEGCIIERGPHQGLISERGYYSRMWELYNQII